MRSETEGELLIHWPEHVAIREGGWRGSSDDAEWRRRNAERGSYALTDKQFADFDELLKAELDKKKAFAAVCVEYQSCDGLLWTDDLLYTWPIDYALIGKNRNTFGIAQTIDEAGRPRLTSDYPHTLLHATSSPFLTDTAPFLFPTLDRAGETTTLFLSCAVPLHSNWCVAAPGVDLACTTCADAAVYHSALAVAVPPRALGIAMGPYDITPFTKNGLEGEKDDQERRNADSDCWRTPYDALSRYTLPMDTSIVTESVALDVIVDIYTFFEKQFSTPFPFPQLKLVFVHDLPVRVCAFAGVILLNREFVHTQRSIDIGMELREQMAVALANEWFGCYVSHSSDPSDTQNGSNDMWITFGLKEDCARLFLKARLGDDYAWFRHVIENQHLCYKGWDTPIYTDLGNGGIDLALLPRIHLKSAHVFRGFSVAFAPQRTKVFKLLVNPEKLDAKTIGQQTLSFVQGPLITRQSMLQLLTHCNCNLSTYYEQWVKGKGFPPIKCSYKKGKTKEIDITFDRDFVDAQKNFSTLTIKTFETGTEHFEAYNHSVHLTSETVHIRTQAKVRGRKSTDKFKSDKTETKSPVQWLQVDPDYTIPRYIIIRGQQVLQWIEQLKNGNNLRTKLEALHAFYNYKDYGLFESTEDDKNPAEVLEEACKALVSTIKNDKLYYALRIKAVKTLTALPRQLTSRGVLSSSQTTEDYLVQVRDYYEKELFTPLNDFSDFSRYYLRRDIPIAFSAMHETAPGKEKVISPKPLEVVIKLLKTNDNTKNWYSDAFYLATLIRALRSAALPRQFVKSALHNVEHYLEREVLTLEHSRAHGIGVIGTERRTWSTVVAAECILTLGHLYAQNVLHRQQQQRELEEEMDAEEEPEQQQQQQKEQKEQKESSTELCKRYLENLHEYATIKYDTTIRAAAYCASCVLTYKSERSLFGAELERVFDLVESAAPLRLIITVLDYLSETIDTKSTPEQRKRCWTLLCGAATLRCTALRLAFARFSKKIFQKVFIKSSGDTKFTFKLNQ